MATHYGSSSKSFTYDVFLNFRGEETRNNFTGFLHRALKREGINVFIDSEELWGGEEIRPALLKAIQGSKISIPVFSKGYADSKWCLMELAEIVQCYRFNGQKVLPIFLDVEPRDVRLQTGSLEKSFKKHKKNFNAEKINSWKDALAEVGGKTGCVLQQVNGNQSKLVDLVVDWALSELSSNHLGDINNPVGLDARVKDLLEILNVGSNDVRVVGICGIGGIGKTTIGISLYNNICQSFKMSCFLANVREEASRPSGLISLQEKLIASVSKNKVEISDVYKGQRLIKERFQGQKVLLVLDDVNSDSQLKYLAFESNWFGSGSRIIITSRDEHILQKANVDEIYRPEELDDEQSLRLFSLHAFSSEQPPEDYKQLSQEVLQLAGGLPLTLEVLGSSLSGIRDKEVWRSKLQKLKRIPDKGVLNILKISYDDLEDEEKAIFLDAACFFIGWKKEIVISLWEGCGLDPILAIKKLTQRSLLKFTKTESHTSTRTKSELYIDELRMHDQLQAMGRGIVLEESPREPSERSRLCYSEEILDVLQEHKGTPKIEGIFSYFNKFFPTVSLHKECFVKMSKLRFLCIDGAHLNGDFPHLPSSLIMFSWKECPLEVLPATFYHKKLVHVDLSKSQIEEAWTNKPQNENQRFHKLRYLSLSGCDNLSESPEFSCFPNLETLSFRMCEKMTDLHESIGDLKSLVMLDLYGTQIEELPSSICRLSSLKYLMLGPGPSLEKLPKSIGDLKSLVDLDLHGTQIEELPGSIWRLSSLGKLSLNRCVYLKKLSKLPLSLTHLKVESCITLQKLPVFSSLRNLRELNLSNCKSLEQIQGLEGTKSLEEFSLYDCDTIEILPELPSTLTSLKIESCFSLQKLPDFSSLKNLSDLFLSDCEKLEEIRGLEGTESLETFYMYRCKTITDTPRKMLGQGTLLVDLFSGSPSLNLNDGIYNGLILCLVFAFDINDQGRQWNVQDLFIYLEATIHRKDRRTWCHFEIKIEVENINFKSGKDVIYIHHFKGFDWFGFPLKGIDAIEEISVQGLDCDVKFWKLLPENTEPDQKMPNDESVRARRMVADFFKWSTTLSDIREPHFILKKRSGVNTSRSSNNSTEAEESSKTLVSTKVIKKSNRFLLLTKRQVGVCHDSVSYNPVVGSGSMSMLRDYIGEALEEKDSSP